MAAQVPSPNSPLRPEDLLTDAAGPPGRSQGTFSEVTSQLYASLRQSRKAEATARANLYLASNSPTPPEELEGLAQELSRSLSTGVETSSQRKGGSQHILEMESVRGHLQSMLQASRDTAPRDNLVPGTVPERREEDSFDSDSTATLLNTRPLQELSPPSSAPALEELFPRYTSIRPGTPHYFPDLQGLREALDTEHTRRRHCERHIQNLQTRVLELQQRLAVAVSADRKKDLMIEQLDKTLARVVEGWNQHEAERTEVLRGLQEEQKTAELTRSQQQETIAHLEESLKQTMEALSREQEEANQQQQEQETLKEARQALARSLEREQHRCRTLQEERDEARTEQLNQHRELEALQATLDEKHQAWTQRERHLEDRCKSLQEEGRIQLEREQANSQREIQAAREAQQLLASVQSDVRRLEEELDTARRERDALQLETSLVQARFEAQRVQMESELAILLEQRVTDRLAQVQESSLRQVSSLREQHRKQLQDLTEQHQQELSNQLDQFQVELSERDDRHQQVSQDYELRLAREQARVRELRMTHRQLEEQRVELVERFQAMLRAHWDEAHQLLSSTTSSQVPPPGTPSSLVSGPRDPEKERRAWSMPPAAVALKPVLQQSREPREELPGSLTHPCTPSPDLSLLLGPNFQSQHSFQPLEPKADLTPPSVAGSFPPEHRAERPFPEALGARGEGSLEPGLDPPQLEELKHYLHQTMLLPATKEPNPSSLLGSSATFSPQFLEPMPQSCVSSTMDLLPPKPGPLMVPPWEEAPPLPQPPPPVHKTKVPLAKASCLFRVPEPPPTSPQSYSHGGCSPERGGERRPISPRQLTELSRLLRQYQGRGNGISSTEDLLLYLRGSENSRNLCDRVENRGDGIPRRNAEARLGEVLRKEASSRRSTSTHKAEKPVGRKKSGHSAPGSARSRGGIWR
ncbi:centrobin isoform X4 [Monodelphis domestica]|uniref:centrobin isoform X4 n=2 Tax=Monodelphis domestica TaxID=13616 RepID=UPI000443141E|nr:centrobin isoform X4 [Monodelphis domestica]